MYELIGGTARLVNALEAAAGDKDRAEALAHLLYYYPGQLTEDIRALSDFWQEAHDLREKLREEGSL